MCSSIGGIYVYLWCARDRPPKLIKIVHYHAIHVICGDRGKGRRRGAWTVTTPPLEAVVRARLRATLLRGRLNWKHICEDNQLRAAERGRGRFARNDSWSEKQPKIRCAASVSRSIVEPLYHRRRAAATVAVGYVRRDQYNFVLLCRMQMDVITRCWIYYMMNPSTSRLTLFLTI